MLKSLLKPKGLLPLSIGAGCIIAVLICAFTHAASAKAMESLTSEVFRFHVIANSDSSEDQSLKLKVRDSVLEKYLNQLTASPSKQATVDFFNNNMEEVKATAQNTLRENGCSLPVTVAVTKSAFPIRHYGDVTLPAGTYDCLRIEIGSAKGHNWWCVMYPPLCYVSPAYEESKEHKFEDKLSPSSYSLILGDSPSAPPKVKLKLKVVELWQELN